MSIWTFYVEGVNNYMVIIKNLKPLKAKIITWVKDRRKSINEMNEMLIGMVKDI